jgi:hypothetical protein
MPKVGGPRVKRLTQPDADIRARSLGVYRARPVIALFGATSTLSTDLGARLLPILRSVAARAATENAVFVTGGTDAGVIHLLGVAAESCGGRWPFLVGVAPTGRVTTGEAPPTEAEIALDGNHDVVLLAPGTTWGDETPTLFRTLDALSAGRRPVVAMLVGGGGAARTELIEYLGRDRPVIVLAGSGGLADEVASGVVSAHDDLAVLVRSGRVAVVHINEGPDRVVMLLRRFLGPTRRWDFRSWIPPLAVWPRPRFRAPEPTPILDPGFVVDYPLLAAAIHEANQVVAPAFHECDVQALREENRYRLRTVLALIAGFAAVTFGALQTWLRDSPWPGALVAAAGAVAAALTTVAGTQESLDGYLGARARAELLRSLYFAHLAAPPPTTDAQRQERVRVLETAVAARRYEPVLP